MATTGIRPIAQILEDRDLRGIDCSEDESAALKQFMRNTNSAWTARARRLFPIESDEQLGEPAPDHG